jgi:hypothetical protein
MSHEKGKTINLFPGATEEMVVIVGKRILGPMNNYSMLSISTALIAKVQKDGTEEQKLELVSKLLTTNIDIVPTGVGNTSALRLDVEAITSKALKAFPVGSPEYPLVCYNLGKLHERARTFSTDKLDEMDKYLQTTTNIIAKSISVEEALSYIDNILED